MDLTGPIIAGIITGVITVIGSRRKASSALKEKPGDVVMFSTSADTSGVFRAVERYGRHADMEVEEADEETGRIILGQNARGFHNGYWIVVYVRERPGFPTLVEVGAKPKVLGGGLSLNVLRSKAVNEIKAMLPTR